MTSIGFQNLFRVPQQESDANYNEKLQTFLFLPFQYPARIAIEIWVSTWLLDVSARRKIISPRSPAEFLGICAVRSRAVTFALPLPDIPNVPCKEKMFLEIVQIASNSRLRALATAWYISCIGPGRFWCLSICLRFYSWKIWYCMLMS